MAVARQKVTALDCICHLVAQSEREEERLATRAKYYRQHAREEGMQIWNLVFAKVTLERVGAPTNRLACTFQLKLNPAFDDG